MFSINFRIVEIHMYMGRFISLHSQINKVNNMTKKLQMPKFLINYYNILIIGIDIIEFYINAYCDLVFTIILYLFLFHIFLKGAYQDFSF